MLQQANLENWHPLWVKTLQIYRGLSTPHCIGSLEPFQLFFLRTLSDKWQQAREDLWRGKYGGGTVGPIQMVTTSKSLCWTREWRKFALLGIPLRISFFLLQILDFFCNSQKFFQELSQSPFLFSYWSPRLKEKQILALVSKQESEIISLFLSQNMRWKREMQHIWRNISHILLIATSMKWSNFVLKKWKKGSLHGILFWAFWARTHGGTCNF